MVTFNHSRETIPYLQNSGASPLTEEGLAHTRNEAALFAVPPMPKYTNMVDGDEAVMDTPSMFSTANGRFATVS